MTEVSLHMEDCGLCGDRIMWDNTPNPQCNSCAAGHINLDRLKAALEWCSEIVFDGMDIDGGDFQDEMLRLGLMVPVPASDVFRDEYEVDSMLDWVWK